MTQSIRMVQLLWLVLFSGWHAGTQQIQPTQAPSEVAIHSPLPGQALQGIVALSGNSAVEGFQSAEVSFSYSQGAPDTWFLIGSSSEPVANGELVKWDTTTISDGNYTLRLEVQLEDGSRRSATVSAVRVRNYTPIETDTPAPSVEVAASQNTAPANTLTPTITAVAVMETPIPPNPAEISGKDITQSLGMGVLASLGLLVLLGLYQAVRSAVRKR